MEELINPKPKQEREIVRQTPSREIVKEPKRDPSILPPSKPSQPTKKGPLND